MRRLSWGSLALLACSILAGCGQPSGSATNRGSSEAEGTLGPEQISFGSSLAQMRGHHRVALELYEAGDVAAAKVHAHHPIEEIFASVRAELEEHDDALVPKVEAALTDGANAISGKAPASEAKSAFDEAAALTRDAEASVVGDLSDSDAYRGSVIAALLSVAAHEYEESIKGPSIALVPEYQDGYGFLQEAEAMYEDVAPAVEEVSEEEAEEVAEAFETLAAGMPGVEPPAAPAPAEDVEVAAELVGHELEETVSARILEQAAPEEVVAEIEALLDEIVETYRAGNADEASDLSAEAYLENYEVIEAEVIEKAPEVNDELEPLLGAELRKRIQEDAPPSEIEDMVARAKELLAQALKALEGGQS